MSDLTPFPDIELLLVDLLGDLGTTGTVTPSDLVGNLPFIRVARTSGGDDLITDTSHVDVDVFATTRSTARQVAESVRQRLITPGGRAVQGVGVLDYATTDTAPNEVPWDTQSSIRRFTAAYTITTRR